MAVFNTCCIQQTTAIYIETSTKQTDMYSVVLSYDPCLLGDKKALAHTPRFDVYTRAFMEAVPPCFPHLSEALIPTLIPTSGWMGNGILPSQTFLSGIA